MHFMPFIKRSGHFSSCLSTLSSVITITTITNAILVSILLSFTSVTGRVIAKPEISGEKYLSSDKNLKRQLVVEQVKRRILGGMGLTEPPTFTRNIRRIREQYRNEIQEFLNTTRQASAIGDHHDNHKYKSDDVIKIQLIPSGKRFKVPIAQGNTRYPDVFSTLIHFTIPENPDLKEHPGAISLQSAILSLRFSQVLTRHLSSATSKLLVNVYLVDPDRKSPQANLTSNSIPVQSFHINPRRSSNVIDLDIQSTLASSSLFSTSVEDNVIALRITVTELASPFQDTSRPSAQSFHSSKNSQISHPYINLSTSLEIKALLQKDPTKTRFRRSKRSREEGSDLCRLESVYINFSEIGFDWVIEPEGYEAYYCTGRCPTGYEVMRHFSNIKGLMHDRNPAIPAPSCAPSSARSLNLLHLVGEDQPAWTEYPGMIITGCKCH